MTSVANSTGGAGALPTPSVSPRKSVTGTRLWVAVLFLLPAFVLLGALVVYPIGYSLYRSFFDQSGSSFAGLDNYKEIFTEDSILTAVKNNDIRPIDDQTVTRPGPRLMLGLQLLASTIHPDAAVPSIAPIPPGG